MLESKDIPAGWEWIKLGDLVDNPKADLVDGPFGSNLKSDEYIESGVPVFKIQNIKENRFVEKRMSFISEAKAKSLIRHSFQSGDLIITKLGEPLGLCCKVPKKYPFGIIVADLMRLRPSKSKVYGEYLMSVINSNIVKKQFKSITKGTTRARVNLTIVRDIKIPVPPKPIQQAIVSKIQELFSELDKGAEQLEIVQQQLKIYRKAVLKSAFEGKLTNKNVNQNELPQGWKWERLSDVCDKIQDGSHFSPQAQYDEPGKNRFKYITAKNIRNDYIDTRKISYVDKDFHDSIYSRCNPEFGDVLLTKDGVNTGEVTLNTLHEPFSLLSSVCIFKTKRKVLKSEFLKYFIQSPLGSKAIVDSMTGTAIKRIVLRKIKDSEIVVPPIDEQIDIIQEIECRLSVADKMEESVRQNMQQVEALRQSILKRAFEGKLVHVESVLSPKPVVVNPIPFERKVLAGKIIHLFHDDRYFGLTKFQKVLYILENYIEADYDTNYLRERAGPYDRDFTLAFRKEMVDQQWFDEETRMRQTKFVPGDNVGSLIKDYAQHFRNKSSKIVFVLNLMKDKSTHDAELIATLYAAWNNRILKKKVINKKELVKDFFTWSEKKQEEFHEDEVIKMFDWMKKEKLTPSGFGKVID